MGQPPTGATEPVETSPDLHNLEPSRDDLRAESLAGLAEDPKLLPCKYFYDRAGSQLFDRICELPEYYPTRTEIGILRDRIDEIARCFQGRVQLVELGSGSSVKIRALLDHIPNIVTYMPLDISKDHLQAAAAEIDASYPSLEVRPVCLDYTQPFELPEASRPFDQRVAFFPGSTIGNFHPDQATRFLDQVADALGPGGGLLIGVDLRKSPDVLVPAYSDAAGVTAEFNYNLLRRINAETDIQFDIDRWQHQAVWNEDASRMESHLVSLDDQTIGVGAGPDIPVSKGEYIRTECSYKYSLESFAEIARAFRVQQVWTDERAWFSVQWLVAR